MGGRRGVSSEQAILLLLERIHYTSPVPFSWTFLVHLTMSHTSDSSTTCVREA
jgi:hypothetical protein